MRCLCATLALLLSVPAGQAAALTKLSGSGICHDETSPWFSKTRSVREFADIASCLEVGRLPKTGRGNPDPASALVAVDAGTAYDRALYGDWQDIDGDCMNTRHEVLSALSTGPVTLSRSGCSVSHGRWNDPYTDQIFSDPKQIDIDHMVPLAWAHAHGAAQWSAEARMRFANDPVNLLAVEASTNREKGAKGPLEWLPPNAAFRCEYVTRFHRLVLQFGLTYEDREKRNMAALRAELCD